MTVAALTTIVVPTNQLYRLCRTPACEVVYFGEDATVIAVSELNVEPGFKSRSPGALVCYCFLHHRGDIEAELVAGGQTTIPDRIAEAVRAGNCACEVRNPTGRCCLGDVREAIREVSANLGVVAGPDHASLCTMVQSS